MSLKEKALLIKQDFDDVKEAGGKAQQLEFALGFHVNGTRTDYSMAYASAGWGDATFEMSLYDDVVIAPNNCNQMFQKSRIADIAGIMKKYNATFDFEKNAPVSGTQQAFGLFYNSRVEHLPKLVMPTKSTAYGWFEACSYLHTIDELVCNQKTMFQTSSGASKTFQGCTDLTRCIFSGIIVNDINTQWCPLDDESLISLSVALAVLEELGLSDKTLTLSEDCKLRMQELEYPIDDILNPLGDLKCYTVVVYGKGWDIQ